MAHIANLRTSTLGRHPFPPQMLGMGSPETPTKHTLIHLQSPPKNSLCSDVSRNLATSGVLEHGEQTLLQACPHRVPTGASAACVQPSSLVLGSGCKHLQGHPGLCGWEAPAQWGPDPQSGPRGTTAMHGIPHTLV